MWTIKPISPSEQVFKITFDTDAIDGKASPLKPRDDILNKSSSVYSLLVACLSKHSLASSLFIPVPLSITFISLRPASFRYIYISVLLASTEFSTSSFTTERHFSTTSPAAILFDKCSLITLILFINTSSFLLQLYHFWGIKTTHLKMCC